MDEFFLSFAALATVLHLILGLSGFQLVGYATAGLKSVTIRHGDEHVSLQALDFPIAHWVQMLFPVSAGLYIVAVCGFEASPWWGFALAVHFALPLGCRLRVVVNGSHAALERRILFGWVWKRVELDSPCAWVDGWGDRLDPEALWVGESDVRFERDAGSFELGWSTCYSGERATELSVAFNDAVRRLREQRSEATI